MKGGPTSTIRSSLDPGKTAGDLAKERNKLEVSRRIDQVPPAQKSNEKNYLKTRRTDLQPILWMLLQISFEKASCGFLLLLNPYWKMSYMMHWQIWEVSKILENLRVQLGLPRYPCNAIPLSVKSQKIPNARGRKSSEQLFSVENLEMEIGSHLKLQPFTLWLPEKDPVTFFHRICQLVQKTSGDRGSLFDSQWILSLHLISIILDFTREKILIKT